MPGLPSPLVLAALALTTTSDDPTVHPWVLWVAALLLGLALLLLLAVALATSPRRPRPAEATMELGAEPPAVVDLLTDDFEVTSEAVPATLLDLAARGWCTLEAYGPDQTICRLDEVGARRREPLLPYEQRVLDHLRGLASGGVVPAEALTTGPEDASERWWKAFRREVIADAQARGLCRRRWPRWLPGVAWLGILGGGGLLWYSGVNSNDEGLAPLAVGVIAALLVTVAAASHVSTSKSQRDTPDGLAAASRWLGVRRYLVEHGQFAEQPAAAVAVWDRYLAHAAAMDLAGLAVQQLPLGAEDDRHAWSAESGEWRPVIVDYPRVEPGWGRHPAAAIALGLLGAAASVGVMWATWQYAQDTSAGGLLEDVDPELLRRAGWGALVVCALCLVPLGYAAVELWRGVADCFSSQVVEGLVLRTRARSAGLQPPRFVRYFAEPERRGDKDAEPRWYVAVDTGEAPRIDAWRVRGRIYRQLHQHQRVRVEVRPRLGHVRSVEHLGPIPVKVETVPIEVDLSATPGGAALLAAAQALVQQR